MISLMYSLITLLFTIVFLCALPAYLIGRKGIRESLLAAEEGFSTSSCIIFYHITGLVMLLLLLYFAYHSSALIYGCINGGDMWCYIHAATSTCATFLCAWVHIHTRRARQRRSGKHALNAHISSLLSGIINSVGFICLFMGLVQPPLALLGVLVFVLRYMLSYTAHQK
jgi:hypothetical protein